MINPPPHPICKQIRELRRAAGLSLTEAANRTGVPAIVLGSYERGDRKPPLTKVDEILAGYGYVLAAVPNGFDAVRLRADMASELRAIASQLEKEGKNSDVLEMSRPTARLPRL